MCTCVHACIRRFMIHPVLECAHVAAGETRQARKEFSELETRKQEQQTQMQRDIDRTNELLQDERKVPALVVAHAFAVDRSVDAIALLT